jgi:hypothetical protein
MLRRQVGLADLAALVALQTGGLDQQVRLILGVGMVNPAILLAFAQVPHLEQQWAEQLSLAAGLWAVLLEGCMVAEDLVALLLLEVQALLVL